MKIITNYEVEGCWTNNKNSICRKCGSILEPTPKEGHYNSKYWELQIDDGYLLVNCPNGCSEKSATKAFHDYSKIKEWCTNESKSYNYELDYLKIQNAWIDPKGKVYPVYTRGHIDFADCIGSTEQELENKGWLKLSANRDLMWEKSLTNKQINFCIDYMLKKGFENRTKDFMEYIIEGGTYFKI